LPSLGSNARSGVVGDSERRYNRGELFGLSGPWRSALTCLFVAHDDGETVVRFAGEIDLASAERLAETLDLLDGPLVVDCSALDFIDSSGLHVLVDAVATHGSVTLRRASPFVVEVVELLGLDRTLEIETRGARAKAS
jgi:anti-anti-sigma factor